MNSKSVRLFALVALVVVIGSTLADAHKKFYGQTQPIYEGHERCVCDCARPQPVLPNKPYYGNAGYHQPPPPPRPSGGGYGNSGAYAVAGSYGSGSGQASGGY